MLLRACLLIAGLYFASENAKSQTPFRFTETAGSYGVGLNVVQQYDHSRNFQGKTDDKGKTADGERARPLQTLVWYPAKKTSNKAMTVDDYKGLLATETNFSSSQVPAELKSWLDGLTPSLQNTLWAVHDAPFAIGKYPVVIYAPGFRSAAWENADLCEYLASHGYVVIASPSMGASTRAMTTSPAGVEAQAADLSFLIGFAHTLPSTDTSKVAIVGYSWGGLSSVLAASRDNRITTLVELDGSIRYFPGLAREIGIEPERIAKPMLFFTRGAISMEDTDLHHPTAAQVGPSVLNHWTNADLLTVHEMALDHNEFSSMYQRNEQTWKSFVADHPDDYTREDGIIGYAWMARYTLEFLDAYIKQEGDAMAFLKKAPTENGAPKHYITVDFRAAKVSANGSSH